MKHRLKDMRAWEKTYNPGDLALSVFGLRQGVHYDALVVAPGWKPDRILEDPKWGVTHTAGKNYISGYEVTVGDKLLGWIQCASGACNLIDHLTVCLGLDFDKLIFLGAVGSLTREFQVGDVCTPSSCVDGTMACAYLLPDVREYVPFREVTPNDPEFVERVLALADFPVKRGKVFCTDTIFGEYSHLDFIRTFQPDLIEMETAAFYTLADMMEKPAVALFAVSDNSATGEPLVAMPEEQHKVFHRARSERIPRLLERIVNLP